MPPIHPLSETEASPELKETYAGMKKKFGRMPNIFGLIAQRPEALKTFLPLYAAITGPGSLPHRYKELAYLKTSLVNACAYCSRAHTSSAKKAGITDEEIRSLIFYERSSLFDEKDRLVIHFADQVTRGAATIRVSDLEELRKQFSEEQIVELTLTVAVANFTNRVNDALLAEPDLGD